MFLRLFLAYKQQLLPRLVVCKKLIIPLAVAHDGEHLQSLCLLLHKSLLSSLEEHVKQGHAAVYKWINIQAHGVAYFEDKHAFMNINSLADLGL